ncbi:ABC transporter substrate-binding protein [Arthrobacter sp. MMS18-M83]|uniref:ABC transporter substrate-binding protein n=1 Tax=Arthrobacter sp. MMS18-M83 TaxID=2996261 RepID=UPI00227A5F90|nr:ABC transporter substrate-binding protein [Arthrobacter sp. MMS18-M83]WAH97401.1 ABC transporter substrate-binding protein [Arthrobacter sp. MMS18-M83]
MHHAKKKRSILSLVALTAAAALLLSACASTKSASTEPVTRVKGGTLRIAYFQDPASFDPAVTFFSPTTDGAYLTAIYSQLVQVDQDGKVTPDLALSVTSKDLLNWEIKLRPNVKFSDGTPLNAEAVKFNFERYAQPTSTQTFNAANKIAKTTAVDDVTVDVQLKSANGQFPTLLMQSLGMMVSPTAVKKSGADFGVHPVGAGPFMLTSRTPGSKVAFDRNPNYWDEGKPYLDKLLFTVQSDMDQSVLSFQAGEADVWAGDNPTLVKRLVDAGFNAHKQPNIGGWGFLFNFNRAPTDDVRVRQALAYATDLTDWNAKVQSGNATIATSIFPEGNPLRTEVRQPLNDLKKAQALIDSYVADKGPVTLTINATAGTFAKSAEVLQQQWSRLHGVTVKIEMAALALNAKKFAERDFQVTATGFFGIDPSWDMEGRFSSGSRTNFSGVADPGIDALFKTAGNTLDLGERKKAYSELEQKLWAIMPQIDLYYATTSVIGSSKVVGLNLYGPGYLKYQEIGFSK